MESVKKYTYQALNIRLIKTKHDLNNIQLGKIIGRSDIQVAKYVKGSIPLNAEQIELLCNKLEGVTPLDFYDVSIEEKMKMLENFLNRR